MAAIHVLTGDGSRYRAIVHLATPAGSNLAGITWKNVILGAGLNVTRMTEGAGAGQITTLEKTSIIAGDLIEIEVQMPVESGGATPASIDDMVAKAVAAFQAKMQREYKYYGFTRG